MIDHTLQQALETIPRNRNKITKFTRKRDGSYELFGEPGRISHLLLVHDLTTIVKALGIVADTTSENEYRAYTVIEPEQKIRTLPHHGQRTHTPFYGQQISDRTVRITINSPQDLNGYAPKEILTAYLRKITS